MSGRDQILAGIRRSLNRGALDEATVATLRGGLAAPRRNLIPARATILDAEGRAALFRSMAEEVAATVEPIATLDAVPAAVADYLARLNLPPTVVAAPDPQLAAIPWDKRPLLTVRQGRVEDADPVAVTACFAGIAETGTLMLLSGPESPTRNNFLPDTHIVVMRKSQIVGTYEEAWTKLRARHGAGNWTMPRTVNFITGPSRTADIEQRVELGAHGPRRLHIILVEDGDGASQG